MPPKRVLVTAALPYANGSLHLGHLVEYCQADIYTRALKRLGAETLYICANDAHGTPIEVNAGRLGIKPEELVARVHEEHLRDFARFDVEFDHFSITHSDANREIVEGVYQALREGGQLVDQVMELSWCEKDQRFLPDRYVKGTCPHCKTQDQYGDVCENCQRTYQPTDLVEPYCILCGTTPERRKSPHVFFKLSSSENVEFLREWIDGGSLQPDQANYVKGWVEKGLRDWCISRDGPYFGFAIPDRPDKYFYVWLDAPFGYAAASAEWAKKNGVDFDELWRSPDTRIEHIIGKDIVYFHTLFWPAVLKRSGYSLPTKVHVHGMLTIDGQKMSKSRGTFINAAVFAEHVEPQALRYFYASKLGSGSEDLDLALDDFVLKTNTELVNKHANLFSRAAQFLLNKLDGKLGDLPFAPEEALEEFEEGDDSITGLARRVVTHCRRIEDLYRDREFGAVVRELGAIADIGNEFMQARAPWNQLKEGDEAGARETCTFALNVCAVLATYMWPIVPRFCEAGMRILARDLPAMRVEELFRERNRPIGKMERLFERIDAKAVEAIVEASKQTSPGARSDTDSTPDTSSITFDDFMNVELRVGVVAEAERVKKSKKLLKLQIDLGEASHRQVVAGIALRYSPEDVVGRRVVVVSNLAPAKLMSVESQGMVLAGGEGDEVELLEPAPALAPGTRIR